MKKFLLVLVVLVLLSSCTPVPELPSILSGNLCGDLCWNDIVVGETTKQELLELVAAMPDVDQSKVFTDEFAEGGTFDGELYFQYYRNPDDTDTLVKVVAYFINQKIVYMIFQGDLGLTYQEVEETFGSFDYVTSFWVFKGRINLHVINSVQGLQIHDDFKSEESYLTPDTEVRSLILFYPSYFEYFFEADKFSPDHEFFTMYDWVGYGKIEDLYYPQ